MSEHHLSNKLELLSNNLCMQYSQLVDTFHQQIMEKALAAGHKGLKLSHALVLSQVSVEGSRISDLAIKQGVSKQAIGQVANELEKLGYISRKPDPTDRRSRKLVLTEQGITLITQSAAFIYEVENEIIGIIGKDTFNQITDLSITLFKQLKLDFPDAGEHTPSLSEKLPLIVYATSISNDLDVRLKALNHEHGHPPLKRSYWHILEKLNKNGVRVNDLAELSGVSKQAISQLANEIEKSGYIEKINDNTDKRSKRIVPTTKGICLINDTIEAAHSIESNIATLIGKNDLSRLKAGLTIFLNPDTAVKSTPSTIEEDITTALKDVFAKHTEQSTPLLTKSGNQLKLSKQALILLGKLNF